MVYFVKIKYSGNLSTLRCLMLSSITTPRLLSFNSFPRVYYVRRLEVHKEHIKYSKIEESLFA